MQAGTYVISKPVLPQGAEIIIKNLNRAGYEAFIVGGCVRDGILGRAPSDWDIASSAPPPVVKSLFEKTLDTGLEHGTVTVMLGPECYEVTTFRVDGRYEDSRHPENVEFTGSVEADLSRRDFTMNAVAYHPEKGFIDPFGGMEDIEAGLIRSVGCAGARFAEDALRMLRAVRFSAQLGFNVDKDTLDSISQNSGLIARISGERIREELTRILVSENPLKFELLQATGLLHHIMPEFELCFGTPQNHPYHVYDVARHSLHAVEAVENDLCLRWTMLLHDIGKPVTRTTDENGVDHFYGHAVQSAAIAENILKRLKFDNAATGRIQRLVRQHDRPIAPERKAVARAVYKVGGDIFEDLLKIKTADKLAQNPGMNAEGLQAVKEIGRIYEGLMKEGVCLELKDLAINGNDLVNSGWSRGKDIGRVLKLLLERVVDDPGLNSRDKLLELAEKLK